jgi:hypothetical protein
MLEVGQKVLVISDKGIAYDATILARAKGEDGPPAYKVALNERGPEQLGQWHRACNIFLPEVTESSKEPEEDDDFLDNLLKMTRSPLAIEPPHESPVAAEAVDVQTAEEVAPVAEITEKTEEIA